MKICTLCKIEKPVSDFYKRASGTVESRCKVCFKSKQRDSSHQREELNAARGDELRLMDKKKKCCRCLEERPYSAFDRARKNLDGHAGACKACSGPYSAKNYARRRDEKLRRGEITIAECLLAKREFYAKYLKEHPCVDCGESDILVLQADHLRDKADNISRMIGNGTGLNRLVEELEKCVIRCANCHQKKTIAEFGSWRLQYV